MAHRVSIRGTDFVLPARYQSPSFIGGGTFGVVVSVKDALADRGAWCVVHETVMLLNLKC